MNFYIMSKLEVNDFTLEDRMNFENEKQSYYEVRRKFILTELSGLQLDSDISFEKNVEILSTKVLNLARELTVLAQS